MTATAGPGVSLMSEGLGLGWVAEIPLVVVNVQRGGPATGLPTKTEQSDLMSCMFPAHGDVRMPVIAVGTVEECFYGAAKAIEWAEKYQGPVILMSEMALGRARPEHPQARPEQGQASQALGLRRQQRLQAVRGIRTVAHAAALAIPAPTSPTAASTTTSATPPTCQSGTSR